MLRFSRPGTWQLTPLLIILLTLACKDETPTPVPAESSAASTAFPVGPPARIADTVYFNASFYTVNPTEPRAEAVAVIDGKFAAVGSNDDVLELVWTETAFIDLGGNLVLPGIHDVHVHPGTSGLARVTECTLPGTLDAPNLQDTLDALEACKPHFPGDGWFRGTGYSGSAIPADQYNKATLDGLFPDRPVFLADESGHNAWINSEAIEVAGVSSETELPPGNFLEVDQSTGELTGKVIEIAAMDAVRRAIPAAGKAQKVEGMKAAIAEAHASGITSWFGAAEPNEDQWLPIWKELDASGELKIHTRISQLAIGYGGEGSFQDGSAIASIVSPYKDEGFEVMAAKIFVDGTAEGGTAAFLEPAGLNGDLGSMTASPQTLQRIVASLDEAGIQIKAHSIGDRAVREILDAYAMVIQKRGSNELRHHVAHAVFVHADDLARFTALGVPVESNIGQAAPMAYMTDVIKPVTPETMWEENTLPFGKLVASGAMLAGASDWSSLPFDPFYGMAAAVTRTDPGRPELGAWSPQNRLSLEQIIQAYTMGGAYIMHSEDETGSIEVGKSADMVVVDRDLFAIEPMEIYRAKPLRTIFAGEVVWEAAAAAE